MNEALPPSGFPDYRDLVLLRQNHPARRLLAADHAPLVLVFLHAAFIAPNRRSLSQQTLVTLLEDQLFELLRQMAEGSETDPKVCIAELERKRTEIDAEIERIRAGELELMDPARLRDRFLQMQDTARRLLADFRAARRN